MTPEQTAPVQTYAIRVKTQRGRHIHRIPFSSRIALSLRGFLKTPVANIRKGQAMTAPSNPPAFPTRPNSQPGMFHHDGMTAQDADTKPNPYFCTGPTLISFSGGRTSAYMLKQIIDEHGGTLPEDVHVCFANTGKEREETLRFVHECETRWNVKINWLEWLPRTRGTKLADRFQLVGLNSAARNGEPFAALIRKKQYLPNSQMRYCTIELKIKIMGEFMRSLGYKQWANVIGLRYDEPMRVFKALSRNDTGKERHTAFMPLSKAKVTVRDIRAFWDAQPFDLQLMSHEGNCDLCFLKGRGKRAEIVRRRPDLADWWIEQEAFAKCKIQSGARFLAGESYTEHRDKVLAQPMMELTGAWGDDTDDEGCGDVCGGED